MALLSATQGTPERVWSLLNILASHDGTMEREALVNWLNPQFVQGTEAAPEQSTAVSQTIQAAHGLGLIDLSQRSTVRLLIDDAPSDLPTFADLVHEKLTTIEGDEADSVLLEVYAWQVVQTELAGSSDWIDEASSSAFADAADIAVTPPGWTRDRRFNSTKYAPWRRWLDLVGLSATLPSGHDYPYVAPRLERVIRSGDFPSGQELSPNEFLSVIARELPYLDGGQLFRTYASRAGLSMQPRTVTRTLSAALRELSEDGLISLPVRGDSSDNYSLAPDPFSKVRTFAGVIVQGTK